MIMTLQPISSSAHSVNSVSSQAEKTSKDAKENSCDKCSGLPSTPSASSGSTHNMFCLNIFERAVQDPCSKDCDREDDNLLMNDDKAAARFLEDPDPLEEEPEQEQSFEDDYTMSPKNYSTAFCMSDGNSPTNTVTASPVTSAAPAHNNWSRHCRLRKLWSGPQSDDIAAATAAAAQSTSMAISPGNTNFPYNNLIHQQSSPIPLTATTRPNRSRTNSSTLIRQISRQSIIDNNNNNNNSIGFYHSHNNSNNNIDTVCGCGSSSSPTSNEECSNSRRSSVVQRSRSSCSGIPTHLYGLEKYVSSALDALSAGDYDSNAPTTSSPEYSSTSPSFSGNSLPTAAPHSSPHSDSSLNSLSSPPFLASKLQSAKKTRKKSFIEMSLANSFSQYLEAAPGDPGSIQICTAKYPT